MSHFKVDKSYCDICFCFYVINEFSLGGVNDRWSLQTPINMKYDISIIMLLLTKPIVYEYFR